MPELAEIFEELGISHYLPNFLEQGFDTWEAILDITESDFDHLEVKLGHRRKIQRRIATSRGLSTDRALVSPRHSPVPDRPEDSKPAVPKVEIKETNGNVSIASPAAPHGAKRKYRRHPKADENAPERPPSAYVIFSNKMREELKGRNLSFTEIAKLVGENWQNLTPSDKEIYDQQAFVSKERFNNQLSEYKKTEHYKAYQVYLAEFKSKHSSSQQGVPADSTEVQSVKRAKIDSSASSGTDSNSTSQRGIASSNSRDRANSSVSTNGHWYLDNQGSQVILPKLSAVLVPYVHSSSGSTASTVLPVYRDSIVKAHQSLPWREAQRDMGNQSYARPERAGEDYANDIDGSQHNTYEDRRSDGSNPPPLISSESTNSTSSSYFGPQTPSDPHLERGAPAPATFYQQAGFDHRLPPLQQPSISPPSMMVASQLSSQDSQPWSEQVPVMAPKYGHGTTASQQYPQSDPDSRFRNILASTASEEDLIPISALLSLHKGC